MTLAIYSKKVNGIYTRNKRKTRYMFMVFICCLWLNMYYKIYEEIMIGYEQNILNYEAWYKWILFILHNTLYQKIERLFIWSYKYFMKELTAYFTCIIMFHFVMKIEEAQIKYSILNFSSKLHYSTFHLQSWVKQ